MTPEQREQIIVQATSGWTYIVPQTISFDEILESVRVHDALQALKDQNYRLTITIEATAPAAAHSFCGKGSTVAEAVRSLGEMMAKPKEAKDA